MSRNFTSKSDKRKRVLLEIVALDEERMFCVGCNRTHHKKQMVNHHVVAHFDGGLTANWNMLPVCRSCHAIAHNGTDDDAKKLNTHFTAFMVSNFGMLHLMQMQTFRTVVRKELDYRGWTLANVRQINNEVLRTFEAIFFAHLSNLTK